MTSRSITPILREKTWNKRYRRMDRGKCCVSWCTHEITPRRFHAGHNIPYSCGGPTTLRNLEPICRQCNLQMNDRYTIDEWCKLSREDRNKFRPNIDVCADCHKPTGCKTANRLVMCDTQDCTRSYCLHCLGVKECELPEIWNCGHCQELLPLELQHRKKEFAKLSEWTHGVET